MNKFEQDDIVFHVQESEISSMTSSRQGTLKGCKHSSVISDNRILFVTYGTYALSWLPEAMFLS